MTHFYEKDNFNGSKDYFIIEGVLKWYNPQRGYGFLVPNDGSGDVMLHRTLLEDAGYPIINPGAVVRCEAEVSDRGVLAVRILSVVDRALQISQELLNQIREHPHELSPGVVKWYHTGKGYGFALSSDVEGDILLTRQILNRCGIPLLSPGQRILMRIIDGERGKSSDFVRVVTS